MRHGRGQTLVMMALTMLLLTLLVLMTLGIGVRIHERTEQQVVADAAAYSEAVVTARTFNAVSSMNRVLIAQLSSVAAAQALLSWAGFYHGTLNQARDLMFDMDGAVCGKDLTAANQRIVIEDRRLIDIWEPPGGGYEGIEGRDVLSAEYIRSTLYRNAIQIAEDQKAFYQVMTDEISPAGGGGISRTIVDQARTAMPFGANPAELSAPDQPITRQERSAAVDATQTQPRWMARALMATRGIEPFLSSREATTKTGDLSAAAYVEKRLNAVINDPGLIAHVSDFGTSYLGGNGPQVSSGTGEKDGFEQSPPLNYPEWRHWEDVNDDGMSPTYRGAWAQDYGHFYFETSGGCVVTDAHNESFGYLVTTGPSDDRDNHMWQRGNVSYGDYRELNDEYGRVAAMPPERHGFQLTPPGATPPSIWPVFVDFKAARLDEGVAEVNQYGVPKTVVPIVRDYSARPHDEPWELKFNFKFTAAGSAIDLRDQRAGGSGFTGKTVAVATGLTYYHRGAPAGGTSHSREPPNFLNPFWRATLVAGDVDESFATRGKDVIDTLNTLGETTSAAALTQLRAQGFEAIP